MRFTHKNTSDHVLSLDAQGLGAARRLHAHAAPISDSFLRTTLRHASRRAGLGETLALNELRHSFVTWATEEGREVRPKVGGVPVETVARVVGHRGTRTTTNFYLSIQVPVMIAIPLRLEHPADPPVVQLKSVKSA